MSGKSSGKKMSKKTPVATPKTSEPEVPQLTFNTSSSHKNNLTAVKKALSSKLIREYDKDGDFIKTGREFVPRR